jgi:hypothetical protein
MSHSLAFLEPSLPFGGGRQIFEGKVYVDNNAYDTLCSLSKVR